LLDRAQAAADEGIFQPRFGFDSAISEIQRVTAGVPFNASDDSANSPIWIDIQTKLENLVERQVLDSNSAQSYLSEAREILSGEVIASYQKVLAGFKKIGIMLPPNLKVFGPCLTVRIITIIVSNV
jgi:hypothetical protein